MNAKAIVPEGFEVRQGRWIEIAERMYTIKRRMKQLKLEEEQLKKELIKLSNITASFGNGYVFKPYERPGSVDYKSIPELQQVDLDAYRKPSITVWKLDVL